MNRLGAKKLTLHMQTLRRLTRDLTEQELVRILGGSDDGPLNQPDDSIRVSNNCTYTCRPGCAAA